MRHKRPHIVGFLLYQMSSVGKPTEIERSVVDSFQPYII
jgi:hypothetical protein